MIYPIRIYLSHFRTLLKEYQCSEVPQEHDMLCISNDGKIKTYVVHQRVHNIKENNVSFDILVREF